MADIRSQNHALTIPAIPSHLKNGNAAAQKTAFQTSRDEAEREHTFAAIQSSIGPRKEPIYFDEDGVQIDSISQDNDLPHAKVKPADAKSHSGPYSAPPSPSLSRRSSSSAIIKNPTVDFDGLSWPSIGTRSRLEASSEEAEARLQKLSGAVRTMLECIGEDPEREGLHGTPERYAKAMLYFTKGYEENLRDIVNGAVFHEDHDELVIVKDIEVYTLCEHHLVPFIGKIHVGYIPNQRVIGLSKIARIVEMFARRLQVQERLTKQVALAISEVLKPQGVAVVMESSHMCMVMRGVQKTGSTTTTSCMLGRMRSTAKTREEFLNLLNRH